MHCKINNIFSIYCKYHAKDEKIIISGTLQIVAPRHCELVKQSSEMWSAIFVRRSVSLRRTYKQSSGFAQAGRLEDKTT
jgi:hypothetical protein